MIYDTLQHWKQYAHIHPGIATGLEFLATHDLANLPDGRWEIDGERVYANLMRYDTKAGNPTPERHERYADIFYLLEGEEEVAVCPVEELGRVVLANPEGDLWLQEGAGVRLPLGGGRFLALFPGDGHAPSIGPHGPAPARKCVVKVLL